MASDRSFSVLVPGVSGDQETNEAYATLCTRVARLGQMLTLSAPAEVIEHQLDLMREAMEVIEPSPSTTLFV